MREGRLIIGEYVLSQHDFLVDQRFDDAVMRCFAHHENHAYDYANESEWSQIWVAVFGMWRFGFGGELPYRCFVPIEIDGLLIGCRAMSQDHDSMMMLRMQRDLQKIGEVAGTAAARCVLEGVCPRKIDVAQLQERLLARGVLTSEEMARPVSPWLTFKDGESNETRDSHVYLLDIFPTLCNMIGIDIPETVEGISFIPCEGHPVFCLYGQNSRCQGSQNTS